MPYKDRAKQKAAQRQSYLRHKARILENQQRNRDEINLNRVNLRRHKQALACEIKRERGCEKCGRKFPACLLEFHHRDPATKDATVSFMINEGASDDLIKAEIEKCDVICVVCHRLEHCELTDEVLAFLQEWL